MRPTIRFFAVLAALALVFAACQTPSTDPDEALRDLLTATPSWLTDDVNYADAYHLVAVFAADGSLTIGNELVGTWQINNGAMTLTTDDGAQVDVTPAGTFEVAEDHVFLQYNGELCHLIPLSAVP